MGRTSAGISSEDVLEAASRAFAEGGYRGTNLNDVAAELNVTRQAIYYYYPSKHEILNELITRFFHELNDRVQAARSGAESTDEAFSAMLRAHISYVATVPDLAAIFTREYVSLDQEAQAAVQARRRELQQLFVEAFEAAQSRGRFRDLNPHAAVSFILGASNWIFRWYHPGPAASMSVEQLADLAVDLLGNGYREPDAAS